MLMFFLNRLKQSIILMFLMSLMAFGGMYLASDPVETLAPEDWTEQDKENFAKELGLDQPVYIQYFRFIGNMLQGDFGRSFVYDVPVLDLILERLPATIEITVLALIIGVSIGIAMGVYSGLRRKTVAAKGISFITTVGYSTPNFWQALLLIMLFSVWLQWLPTSGREHTVEWLGIQWSFLSWQGFLYMLLPALNLAIGNLCLEYRLARSGTQEVMFQEYMTFARAKGIGKNRLIGRHLLRNILIPIVTITGLELGGLIAFATVTETIFSWPGVGKLLLSSIHAADRPVVVAYLILIAVMFVTINFIVDILYALLDPRIRYS